MTAHTNLNFPGRLVRSVIICNLESLSYFSCPNSDPKHSILFVPKPFLLCSHFPRAVEPNVYFPSDFCSNVILWFLSFSHISGCFASVLNSGHAFVSSHSWGLGLGLWCWGGWRETPPSSSRGGPDLWLLSKQGPRTWGVDWRTTERSEGSASF